jgi:hypothetical protein
MGGSDDMIVLPIPLDLCPSRTPGTQSHERFIPCPEIPASDPTIHTDSGHEVRIPSVPIDVGNRPRVRVDGP